MTEEKIRELEERQEIIEMLEETFESFRFNLSMDKNKKFDFKDLKKISDEIEKSLIEKLKEGD